MERYIPGIGLAAGSMMIKWNLLDKHIKSNLCKLENEENINVFINFESVLKNLYLQQGLTNSINFYKMNVVIELESAVLNLMAHYRMYFKKEKCEPKVYFYYTDIDMTEQQMFVYNKDYRTYYHNKYIQDPKFNKMGKLLKNIIIEELSLIISYIPGCYFIKTKRFDSSIVPYIVSTFSDNKNVIISGDIFDTLYMFDPNFFTIYINRRFQHLKVTSDIPDTVQSIIKNESSFDLNIFNSEMYYRLLLSIKGNKIRNIKSAKGFGYGKLISTIKKGIDNSIVLKDFESIDSIIELFPSEYREDIKVAFQCTSIYTQYELLNEADIESVKHQIVDKFDISSLEALNNKRFLDFPINLQGLLN